MRACCFSLFLLLVLTFSACQKEISGDIIPGGGGGGTSSDYQPTTAGSEWNYTSTAAGNYKIVSIGSDSLINGLQYAKFDNINNGTAVRFYVNKNNGVYRNYGYFPAASQVIDLIVLKDSAVGTTWTNTLTTMGFSNYHKYTVHAKGQQRTVKGVNYNNVIELDYEFLFDDPLGGGMISGGTGKNFWAKGVGAIESFYNLGFFGINISDTTQLVSYTIH